MNTIETGVAVIGFGLAVLIGKVVKDKYGDIDHDAKVEGFDDGYKRGYETAISYAESVNEANEWFKGYQKGYDDAYKDLEDIKKSF